MVCIGSRGYECGVPINFRFSAQINGRSVFRPPRDPFQGLMVLDLLMLSLYIGLFIGECIFRLKLCTSMKIHQSL